MNGNFQLNLEEVEVVQAPGWFDVTVIIAVTGLAIGLT